MNILRTFTTCTICILIASTGRSDDSNWPQWRGPTGSGKTAAIARCFINQLIFGADPLARQPESEPPIFVAGDSDTDLAMLEDA
ncbi:MAG: hypothetical protein ACF8AM_09995, partial [Rhodopirellula sp. JB055]|uniref:hypothetical protein n=1 Tax=Rhodopirellula sp. JB055 TaxID=3342846 RepID=UPI00370A3763